MPAPIDATPCRVRISLQSGELELQGSETFVGRYADAIDALVALVQSNAPNLATSPSGNPDRQGDRLDGEFPEALHLLRTSSGTDQILLAGSFAARGSADGTFSTADANTLLLGQGIKLANPSQSMINNQKAKRLFKVGARWKVSRTGDEYLKSLLA